MVKIHSYVIFSKHIKLNNERKIEVTGLTSTACYEEWVASRLKLPKNSAEAFRKALTSHCAGIYGMLPFTPEVETALLEHLRKQEPWKCFRNLDTNIGVRGFSLQGYWEQLREGRIDANPKYKYFIHVQSIASLKHASVQKIMKASQESTTETIPETGTLSDTEIEVKSSKKRPLDSEELRLVPAGSRSNPAMFASSSSQIEFPLPGTDLFAFCLHEFWNEKSKIARPSFAMSPRNVEFVLGDFKLILKQNGFIRYQFSRIIDFIPQGYLHMFILTLYQHTKFNQLKAETSEVDTTQADYLLSSDFAFPLPNEQFFLPDRPIGLMFGDLTTFTMIEADEVCQQLYRGSIAGYHSLNLRVNKQHALDLVIEQLTRQFLHRELWMRTVEYRVDRSIAVFLNRMVVPESSPNCVRIEHQDITDLYAHLL